MLLLRVAWWLIISALIAVAQIGVIAQLPFPFSDIFLPAIALASAIIFRFRPRFLLVLAVMTICLDWYSAAIFGVFTIALLITVVVALHVSTDFITHRSLMGSAVIGALCGGVFAVTVQLIAAVAAWFHGGALLFFSWPVWRTIVMQLVWTAGICAVLFQVVPRWWRDRSPVVVSGRGV